MTPFGHIASAYFFSKIHKKLSLFALILGSILPDLDFLLLFTPHFNQIHRLFTHNLIYVIFLGVFSAFLLKMFLSLEKVSPNGSFSQCPIKSHKDYLKYQNAFYFGLSVFLGGLLHLLIDACWDSNPSNGIGIALFWPFSNRYFSPFNLLPINDQALGWDHPFLMLKAMLPEMGIEFLFFVLFLILFIFKRKK